MEQTMVALLCRAFSAGALKKAVFSKPMESDIVRMTLTPRQIGGRLRLQAETLKRDNKAMHENLEAEDTTRLQALVAAFGQINLLTTVGECELRRAKSGKVTLIGGDKLSRALAQGDAPRAEVQSNNRKKTYILNGSEPFLRLLDVSDENGRVRDKKQSKFRQINRFLELIRDCLGHLPEEEDLRICDLCCGKSYLSFAAYHYFANILGRRVVMTGVDLKPDVVEHCNATARALGFDGLQFLCMDVGKFEVSEQVHLVISLHACDIATDLVLNKALEWRANVILSTPCCHHEMNHMLDCAALSFVAEHSMLRQKLCDAATDALRLKRMEAGGYEVAALELIDPEETPKNIMLRGLRKANFDPNSEKALRLRAEYEAAKAFLVGDATKGYF
ncbi:MAG: SAM-dependent methyltransferase [Clostridia bacterium]|nr:SAM-dependent methyltransferase [Clostridia bacterium]